MVEFTTSGRNERKSILRRRARRPKAWRARRLHAESLEPRWLLTASLLSGLETSGTLWQTLSDIPASPTGAVSYIRPSAGTPFTFQRSELEQLLAIAPLEFTSEAASAPYQIYIPAPDGSLDAFQVVEAPVMAAALAARYPEIHTYRGWGVEDPSTTVRFDLTPAGFHAQVLSPQGTYYIDPYYHLDDSVHISYWREDFGLDPEIAELRRQHLAQVNDFHQHGHETPGESSGLTGETLRTYRLANAATGEYTIFHGGTKEAGQAAIVTAVNRITGIYEVDLTIRMELVPNNDAVVYTNPATDPYTNNNGGIMLDQNQATLDAVIGDANYDIGHVFSTGGGGVAYLGVVGVSGFKARGVTGLPAPTGDAFYVDYVAHEMGHQYGANHTFNGDSGSCAGGQRNGPTAYEPGSGSTIMAYAGICGNDDLQPHSDPYFHFASFDEIIAYVDNSIPNVGTHTATGNTPPEAEAGLDFVIPARTPFKLTASGSDVDGDVLTFNWEEADLGPRQDVNSGDNGRSPIFRSWLATPNPTRYFPRLQDLVNNTTVRGETLPTTNRELKFRMTVRDNNPNGGGVDSDNMKLDVVVTGAPFAVTSPNSALTWSGNSVQTVTWDVAGTSSAPISTANVNILMSTDSGFTYPHLLASNVPNDGSHDILVPNLDTTQARIMVEGAGNVFFDISNANFTVELTDLVGDFNDDGVLDCADVDALTMAIANGSTDLTFDVTGDLMVTSADLDEWITVIYGTLFGDANLDFTVDGQDFLAWNSAKFTSGTAWCSADFNADATTDGQDFAIWNENKFNSAGGQALQFPSAADVDRISEPVLAGTLDREMLADMIAPTAPAIQSAVAAPVGSALSRSVLPQVVQTRQDDWAGSEEAVSPVDALFAELGRLT